MKNKIITKFKLCHVISLVILNSYQGNPRFLFSLYPLRADHFFVLQIQMCENSQTFCTKYNPVHFRFLLAEKYAIKDRGHTSCSESEISGSFFKSVGLKFELHLSLSYANYFLKPA